MSRMKNWTSYLISQKSIKKELNGIHKKMSVMVTAVTNTSKTCRNLFAQENQFRVLTHREYCAASIKVTGEC